MKVTLPDGVVVSNVPEGTSMEDLLGKLMLAKHPSAPALLRAMAQEQTLGDMSGMETFNTGAGLAVQNLMRGGKQMLGMDTDYAENKGVDRALLGTGAGLAGNIGMNVAALAPAALVPGAGSVGGAAAIGSTLAALQPTDTTSERLKNMAFGGALGGGVQTVARYPMETLEVAKKALAAPFKGAKALVDPLTQRGRERILARTLREVAGDDAERVLQRFRNADEIVPGSFPTAAEVGDNAGIAALQRTAAAQDPAAYAARATAQNQARVAALRKLAGTSGERDLARAARDATANTLYSDANIQGIQLVRDPKTGQFLSKAEIAGIKGEITKLMQRPAMQDAVRQARILARNEGVKISNPAGSVKGLDYVKRALDDKIRATEGNERRILVALKNRMLTTVDRLSPEYEAARGTYQQMSRPVNQMEVAQEIADKSIRPLDETLAPAAYARALSDDTAQRVTRFDKSTLENLYDPDQLSTLRNILEDLRRSSFAQNAGRGPGSDTMQKLAVSNLMNRIGFPSSVVHGPDIPGLRFIGKALYDNADTQMRQMLAEVLLDPRGAARVMATTAPNTTGRLANARAWLTGGQPTGQPLVTDPELGQRLSLLARSLAAPATAGIPAMREGQQ